MLFSNLILVCMSLGFMSTAFSTVLAPVAADLQITLSQAQWLTSGYVLALAALTPLSAYLTSRFPTRRLYLAAVGSYALMSAACAMSGHFGMLLTFRIAQACANALIANVTQVSIMTLFEPSRRGRAMGWFGMTQGAAVLLGPVVGGVLTDALGWRSVFWVVAGVCAMGVIGALWLMKDLVSVSKSRLDVGDFLLSACAMASLVLGLGLVITAPVLALGVVVAALVLGGWFVRRQLRAQQQGKAPLLKVSLMAGPVFRAGGACSMLVYLVMMGSSAVLPLYAQTVDGLSASQAGLVVLPGALCMAVVAPFAGRWFDRFGMRPLLVVGGTLLVVSNLATCWAVFVSPWWAAAVNVIRTSGLAMLQMPLMTWANNSIDKDDLPHGSALITALRNVAGSAGVAVFVSIMEVAGTLWGDTAGVAVSYGVMALASGLLFIGLAGRFDRKAELG